MADFSHNAKRTLNRATTTPGRINSSLNQEFVDTRRRLLEINTALRTLKKSIVSTRQSWAVVVRQQRDFTTRLSTSFPQSGDVQAHAAEVELAMRDVQKKLMVNDVEGSPHQRITDVLDRYLSLLHDITALYPGISLLATEKMRYERKVDAIERRKYRRDPEKLARNLEKLAEVRDELDRSVENALVRMRAAFQKHEAVLQCAHHAFWMANDIYLTTVEQATRDVRVESVNVHQLLLDIQLDEAKALAPVPRASMIGNGDGDEKVEEQEDDTEQESVQKRVGGEQGDEEGHEVDDVDLEDRPEYHHVLTSTVTSAPSFDSSTSTVTQPQHGSGKHLVKTSVDEDGVHKEGKLNIPDVPNMKPRAVQGGKTAMTTPAVMMTHDDGPRPIAA